ncbi:MAG: 16S rRNA (cytosine(967)-C(5))-methyltransferase RsmB [Calditrichaeota bacterium]|nr:16S rRNA (cytosine(967)-C(5))-methyltransferase RsmB [Calditrichota bacterium]RQW03178.1 MAG: 16S rRNA (cytosine(967)-C(5))-methyltransferase RsmB [Calditrichota bacterium]
MSNQEDILSVENRPDYTPQIDARTKIVEILSKVDTRHAYSDILLEKEIIDLSDVDKRFVTEVVNGVLRWRLRLDWYLNQLYLGEYDNLLIEVKNNLRSSVYQLLFLDKIPAYAVLYEAVEIAKAKFNQKTANLVNAILRNYLRQAKKFDFLEMEMEILDKLAFRYSHPKWLIQRWIEHWGIDEVSMLCQANNERPRLSVRLNRQIADPTSFFKSLDENQISYEVHPDFPDFVWIDNFQDFRKLDFISRGWVSVQDISTGIPAVLLNPIPGEKVLDMCAAPGGKTGYIADKMGDDGFILALDRHPSRLKTLANNMKRLQLRSPRSVTADGNRLPVRCEFDKILVDAPCTGFGVLRKKVDLKWKRTEQDISEMKEVQLKLLEQAAASLRVGGLMVYSTCTLEPEENEKNIYRFLEKHPEFELLRLKNRIPEKYITHKYFVYTFPHKHQMDGSFAALLQKGAASKKE